MDFDFRLILSSSIILSTFLEYLQILMATGIFVLPCTNCFRLICQDF